jgi:hypothetical protein
LTPSRAINAGVAGELKQSAVSTRDPRVRSQAVVLGYLLVFACVTWRMPFGATFAVALVASFTLGRAPRWWRALVGCVALTGFLLSVAYYSLVVSY